jgi:hypothetical protein
LRSEQGGQTSIGFFAEIIVTLVLSDFVLEVFFRISDGFDFVLVIYEVPMPNATVSAEGAICAAYKQRRCRS